MPDILLSTINATWVHPSLALRLLKANLGPLADRCDILEFTLRQPYEHRLNAIMEAHPSLLGLSVSIWNHRATLELLRDLRGRWREAGLAAPLVVLGGPEVSHLAEDAPLLHEADVVIRGEGEVAFRTLCEDLHGADTALAPELPRPLLLDAEPVNPAILTRGYGLYSDEDLGRKHVYVESCRGCPYGCEFCLSSLDRGVRYFPLQEFLADLDALIARGARMIKFLDRSFNVDLGRAMAILDFLLPRVRRSQEEGRAITVHFELVPHRMSDALMERLSLFPPGSLRVEMGIQTLNAEVASLVSRSGGCDAALEAVGRLGEETSAMVHADLIVGLPGETAESFARGFDLLYSRAPGEIQVGILKKLPGTPLARHDEPFAMRYSPDPPYEVLSTSTIDLEEMNRLKRFARFWELIANRGRFKDEMELIASLPTPGPSGQGSMARRFLSLSETLGETFGRDWGIPLDELRAAVNVWIEGASI